MACKSNYVHNRFSQVDLEGQEYVGTGTARTLGANFFPLSALNLFCSMNLAS